MKFGLSDYYAMFKKRGFRLPLTYFLQNHLFDILNGTDTHIWMPKEQYTETPDNFAHGVLYMCSWTSVIKSTTAFILQHASLEPKECAFVDIGCGKRKVLSVWSNLFRHKSGHLLVGIDYSDHLLEICENNLRRIAAQSYKLIHQDASKAPLDFGKKTNIYYLYNPFDEIILSKVINNIGRQKCFVVYNNPVHTDLFIESGFSPIKENNSWHPIGSFMIFKN